MLNEKIEEMIRAKQENEKAQACAYQATMMSGQAKMAGCDISQPARPTMRERVKMDLQRAERERRKADRLAELDYLLEKHPEVARILDLVEDLGR